MTQIKRSAGQSAVAAAAYRAGETWDAVQRMDNHPARGRSGKSGTIALFGGLLRCMDCGSSMRYMRDYRKKVSEKEPEYKAYVCNR